MSSPQVIDIGRLLEPISADNGVGIDLRQDTSATSSYARIRDARKSARAAERSNLFADGGSDAEEHWRLVGELVPRVFQQSKDLEISCWYVEYLVRKAGFAGLRDGFVLLRQLIEKYWDGIYPLPDDDGVETRVAGLTGLNGEGTEGVLIAPIRTTALTEAGQLGPFAFWQYKQALDVQRLTDEQARADQAAKLGYSLDDITKAVEASSVDFYVNLRDDVRDALDEYKRIGQLLVERCGAHQSPPTSNIVNVLTDVLAAINHIARFKLPAASEAGTQSTETGAMSDGAAMAVGAIKSRQEAFQQLNHISQFFRRTEPHSPISYAIDRAVRWGSMPLSELMNELIPDSGSRTTYGSLTGVSTGGTANEE